MIAKVTAKKTTQYRTFVGFWVVFIARDAVDAIVLHHIPTPLQSEKRGGVRNPVDFHPVEANLRQSFRALAAGRPGADLREFPGVSIASLGVAFQMFNAAFLNGPVSTTCELEQRLELARLCLGTGDSGWAFWFCEDWI